MIPAARKIKTWRENPAQFVHENFGIEPDKWQLEALDAFASGDPAKQRISLQACVGPGKTGVLSWMGWNFLACYGERGEHPKGAAVSITGDNLKDNLWPEFYKWQSRSEWLQRAFKWSKSRIEAVEFPETWFISARSWSKKANEEEQGKTLSGLHSKYVLALIDESGEIPLPIVKAAEQALSNCKFGKIVQAGNPTSLDGVLYAAATKLRHLWYIIRITSDPLDPNRSPRVDLAWAQQQLDTYGRDNPWVMSSILGKFPPSSINSLLGIEDIQEAVNRHLTEDKFNFSQKRMGIDVARFGSDSTIIFPRQGLAAFPYVEMKSADSPTVAARVALGKERWGSEMEFVDGTGGFGSGVIDFLRQAGHSPHEIHFSSSPMDSRYFNKRSEMWFRMSEWVKNGGALPNSANLIKELSAPTYTFQNGKFRLEEKDQIKKRLGFSPDRGDALCLTFALPEMPASLMGVGGIKKNGQVLHDYDPFQKK